MATHRVRFDSPALIFDLEDRYARDRGVHGPNPRPIGPITLDVLGKFEGGNPQPLPTALGLPVVRNESGYYISFGGAKGPDGTILRDALVPGTYLLRIASPSHFYQPVEGNVDVHPVDEIRKNRVYFFDLEPGHAYPFPVESTLSGGKGPTLLRGSVRRTDGSSVAGAQVENVANAARPFKTDENGEWVLVFPDEQPTGNLSVVVTIPTDNGPAAITINDVLVEQGRASSLRQTVLRGQVVDSVGSGIPGAVVRVDGREGQTMTAEDGLWAYYFRLNEFPVSQAGPTVSVTAQHPDGRTLTQTNVEVKPRETLVVPAFRFP